MKKIYFIMILFLGYGLIASASILSGMFPQLPQQQFGATILYPSGGGTGTSTNPSYGQMLVGTSGGVFQLIATSSLGIIGTTYTATYPITLTGSAFGIAFGTTTSNTWAGTQTLTYASSTAFSSGSLCLTGDLPCRTTWPTGNIDFTFDTTYGTLSAATSSSLWVQGNLYASSTNSYIDGNLYATLPNYVPYTGATADVDLGANRLTVNDVDFADSGNFRVEVGGTIEFFDSGFLNSLSAIVGNSADTISLLRAGQGIGAILDLSSLTTSDKTFTFPDKSLTFAGINNETFTGLTTFANATGTQLTFATAWGNLIGNVTGTASGNLTSASIDTIAELNAILTGEDVASTTATLSGDVTGNLGATVVGDNSHDHDATTISGLGTADVSGLDISDDTNLAATYPITLTGDAVGIAFGTTTTNTWANLQTFTSGISVSGDTITDFQGDGFALDTSTLIFDCSDVASTGLACSGEDMTVDSSVILSTEIDTIAEINAILTGEDVASTTWSGATSIVTVGTIAAGTWQGTAIGTAYGGTGLGAGGLASTFIPFGAGTSAFATSSALSFSGSQLTATYASTTALGISGTAYFPGSGIWNSSGRVGIGTTNPVSSFVVRPAVDQNLYVAGNADLANGIVLQSDTDNMGGVLQGMEFFASEFLFYGATTDMMSILASGNVGIGTTSPYAKLSVEGETVAAYFTATTTTASTFPYLRVTTTLEIPNAAAPTVDATGEIAIDTTSGQLKIYNGSAVQVYKPERFVVFGYATSTAWTGTTTMFLSPAYIGETWTGVKCETDAGTLNVSIYDGTNRMNMFNASTTIGSILLTTNNTFTANESRRVDFGTPATSPTKVSCKAAYGITAD